MCAVNVLRFLRSQKFDVDRSMSVLLGYLRMRCENPDWFMDTDPAEPMVAELVKFLLLLLKNNLKKGWESAVP